MAEGVRRGRRVAATVALACGSLVAAPSPRAAPTRQPTPPRPPPPPCRAPVDPFGPALGSAGQAAAPARADRRRSVGWREPSSLRSSTEFGSRLPMSWGPPWGRLRSRLRPARASDRRCRLHHRRPRHPHPTGHRGGARLEAAGRPADSDRGRGARWPGQRPRGPHEGPAALGGLHVRGEGGACRLPPAGHPARRDRGGRVLLAPGPIARCAPRRRPPCHRGRTRRKRVRGDRGHGRGPSGR